MLIYFLLYQVLLLIDASFGFEMEIFEFLNVCQVHGFPKIIGVLTHLDLLKDNKSLKKTKKKLKTRFWTEVYQVHNLFYSLFAVLNNLNTLYYSFKIFPGFWLAKSTCLIHHNQLLMTKFGRILCLARKWRQKCSILTG